MKFLLALLMTLLSMSTMVHSQSSQATGFGRLEIQSPKKKYSYQRVVFADGTKAERFELRGGDCVRSNGDCRDDRERVEFAARRTNIKPGDERWYAWSIFMPNDFPTLSRGDPGYTFGQVHQRDNSGPELMFTLFHDGFFAILSNPFKLDDDPMNPIGSFREIRIANQNGLKGKWNRIQVQAKWSRSEDGFINIWLNGKKVWTYSGPTTNSYGELYFKYGLYRTFVSKCGGPCPNASIYYTNVRQGLRREEVQ